MVKLTRNISFALLFLLTVLIVFAASYHEHDAGYWFENFNDTSGLVGKTGLNVSNSYLNLTNSTGGFDAPFLSEGSAITSTIIPNVIAQWANISLSYIVPENTSIKIRLLDEKNNTLSNTILSGNNEGFSSSLINLSSLQVEKTGNNLGTAKFARLRLNITLSTNDTSISPAIDNITVSWILRKGDLSASPLADTAWATPYVDKRSTSHVPYYTNTTYSVVRWKRDLGLDFSGYMAIGPSSQLFLKTYGGLSADFSTYYDGKFMSLNKNTGDVNWYKNLSGASYVVDTFSVANDSTLYLKDNYADVLAAYNGSDGTLKWLYQFTTGHDNTYTNIADDGTIFTIIRPGNDDTFTVYAFYSNSSIRWTKTIDPINYTGTSQVSIGDDGNIYVGTSTYVTVGFSANYTNQGKLYCLNATNGSLQWNYSTGDIHLVAPVIDSNGTIYTAHSGNVDVEKKIFAIYPNGTLKWQYSIGVVNHSWLSLALRSDDVLLAVGGDSTYRNSNYSLTAINTTNGSVIYSSYDASASPSGANIFTDSQNGLYLQESKNSKGMIRYYDSDFKEKWNLTTLSSYSFHKFAYDEEGKLYQTMRTSTYPIISNLFAMFPWTLSYTSFGEVSSDSTLSFTVTTSMPETNPLTGHYNKMQIVLDSGTKLPLSYSSTDANNNYIWTASYSLPSGISYGNHSFTIEASAAQQHTDKLVRFDSAANDTNNTGINLSGSFFVKLTNLRTCNSNSECNSLNCVHGICRASTTYCGDSYCDSGESCMTCDIDCGLCGGSSSSSGLSETSENIPEAGKEFIFGEEIIDKIKLVSEETLNNVNIKIDLLNSATILNPPANEVYKYFHIQLENPDVASFETAIISFKVDKQWMQDKGANPGDIVMMHDVGIWEPLDTVYLQEQDSHYLYEAQTDSFSNFAVVFQQEGSATAEISEETDLEQIEEGLLEEKRTYGYYYALGISLMLILVILIILYKKKH